MSLQDLLMDPADAGREINSLLELTSWFVKPQDAQGVAASEFEQIFLEQQTVMLLF